MSREAFRSARKLLLRAVELAPTLERRYFAARAAWRLADMTAVIVEMEEVAKAAATSGETQLQGRALTALADAVLYQRADAVGAQRLITEALEVLADESPEIRFEPLSIASQIASWLGDIEAFERWAKLALGAAQAAGRKDQEAIVTHALANAYLHRLDFDEAEPLIERVAELADESGSVFSRGNALARARVAGGAPLQLRRGRGGLCRRARALRRDRQRDARGVDDAEHRSRRRRAGRPRARREAAARLRARR